MCTLEIMLTTKKSHYLERLTLLTVYVLTDQFALSLKKHGSAEKSLKISQNISAIFT
jgi:hypothetical protein